MRLAALAAMAMGMTALAASSTPALATPAQAAPDTTIAVLYFDYDGSSEDMGFLRKGLNQMLVTDLVDTPGVTVVERVRLEEVLAELKLQRSNKIDRASAVRVGKLLGARYLVMGSYFDFKDLLHVSMTLVNVETGAVVGGVKGRDKSADFWALEQRLAAELAAVIGDKIVQAREAPPATRRASARPAKHATRPAAPAPRPARSAARSARPAARPAKMDARIAARYGRALDAMDRGDKKSARSHLEAVVKETPGFDMAAVDLASLAR